MAVSLPLKKPADWVLHVVPACLPACGFCRLGCLSFITVHGFSGFSAGHRLREGTHHALCLRCAKSRLFFTNGSHGSRGPEFCTLQPLLVRQGFLFVSDACHGSQVPEFCTPDAVLNKSCTLL